MRLLEHLPADCKQGAVLSYLNQDAYRSMTQKEACLHNTKVHHQTFEDLATTPTLTNCTPSQNHSSHPTGPNKGT